MKAAVKTLLAVAAGCLLPLTAQAQDGSADAGDAQNEAFHWPLPNDTVDRLVEEQTAPTADATPEEQVLAVVQSFMDGLGNKDAEAMSAAALDTAFLAFVRPGEDGDAARTMPLSRAITSLAETVPDIAEPIRDPVVITDGAVAMVWAPYDFYVNRARNHCGVNVFSLLNRDGEWMIASVVYSYLPDDCPPELEELPDDAVEADAAPAMQEAGE